MKSRKLTILFVGLVVMHLVLLCAGFFAPYDPAQQFRELPYAPPSRIHFTTPDGHWHLRPFVYTLRDSSVEPGTYVEDLSQPFRLHFFASGSASSVLGLASSHQHLFGVDEPCRIMLMGSDQYGRDQFSRMLFACRISLAAGVLATVLALALGTLLGALAGFCGAWIDEGLMRLAELFLALPWLYLLFAVRAFLPLSISSMAAFFLVIGVIGCVGWARPARLVRGIVLSAKERKYVLAARGFGANNFYLLRRHLLPQTYPVLLTQATLLVPQFILAEVTLSFLGLGVAEPLPSLGNMLATLQQYHVMVSYWWMFLPAVALIIVFLSYFLFADALQERIQFATA
jgi:peptide/nickel transport system permease protein